MLGAAYHAGVFEGTETLSMHTSGGSQMKVGQNDYLNCKFNSDASYIGAISSLLPLVGQPYLYPAIEDIDAHPVSFLQDWNPGS
jgi:hypothetical protein